MNLGYDQKLYILAFDHRGSFQKKFFGIEGEPDAEQTAIIADAKHLIFEGMLQAVSVGRRRRPSPACSSTSSSARPCPQEAHEQGLKLAMPAERSGQNMFDFQYGDDFGEHILNASTPTSRRCSSATTPTATPAKTREQLRQAQAPERLAASSTTASSCSSCSCPPRTPSWQRSAATPTATTPSCAPS